MSRPQTVAADSRLLVIGASGHARVVIDLVEAGGRYTVVGILDRTRGPAEFALDYPVLGSDAELTEVVERWQITAAFVALGDPTIRRRLMTMLAERVPQVTRPALVHPSAYVAGGVTLGAGALIMAGAVVQRGSRLGEGAIVNTMASVDHDCALGDYSFVAPGVHLAGNVELGEGAAVFIGATVVPGVHIGARAVVGAGAVVTRDVPPDVIAYGSPARAVRKRMPHEPLY